MNAVIQTPPSTPTTARDLPGAESATTRYARCIRASKKARWDIDADVIRDRDFDFGQAFLPDALSKVESLPFLTSREKRLLTQVQGRTYCYLFGLVERFIGTKMLEMSRQHALGDQVALQAMVRFSDDEIRHQEMFRRLDAMMAATMAPGYTMTADPNAVARAVLAASTWAVLALTCHIELFVHAHYEQSIAPETNLSPLWKDVFMYHWRDECQHVVLDELEWTAEHERLTPAQRDAAVDDLIALVGAVDGILQAQAAADARWFTGQCTRTFTAAEAKAIDDGVLRAYRWQYIVSGVRHPHFVRLLKRMTTAAQMERIVGALTPILDAVEMPS